MHSILEEHQQAIAARYAVPEKKQLQEEVKQLSQRVEELETAYSTEEIARDLGKVLVPAIRIHKAQELVAVSKNGLNQLQQSQLSP